MKTNLGQICSRSSFIYLLSCHVTLAGLWDNQNKKDWHETMPPASSIEAMLFVNPSLLGLGHFLALFIFLFYNQYCWANGQLISTGNGIITLPTDGNVPGQFLSKGNSAPADIYVLLQGTQKLWGNESYAKQTCKLEVHGCITLVVKSGCALWWSISFSPKQAAIKLLILTVTEKNPLRMLGVQIRSWWFWWPIFLWVPTSALQDYPPLLPQVHRGHHPTPGIWVRGHLLECCILRELPHVWSRTQTSIEEFCIHHWKQMPDSSQGSQRLTPMHRNLGRPFPNFCYLGQGDSPHVEPTEPDLTSH